MKGLKEIMRLYHGSQDAVVVPEFGLGQDLHDFGRGFYLTDSDDLAKEWSVYRPMSKDGWIHAFELDFEGLRVLDFREVGVFSWVAELMKHRDADESSAYRRRAPKFVEKFGVKDSDSYDVLVGWRADASYFYIVKAFVRGEVDADCLADLLKLGGYGIQYVVKSPKAYEQLRYLPEARQRTSFDPYHALYERRDAEARRKMYDLIADPQFNRLATLFNDLVKEA